MFPVSTCAGWCCLAVVDVSADGYLLGLVLPWYGASVGRMSTFAVRLPCARLDIDLYGVGSQDRTGWEISFRPYSIAEIFVAEPGPFELHYFLVKRWHSCCCYQPANFLWIPGNGRSLTLGSLRQGFKQVVVTCQFVQIVWIPGGYRFMS